MRLGNKLFSIIIILFFFGSSSANEKITTTPLLNLNEIKPSFEEIDDKTDVLQNNKSLKQKKSSSNKKSISSHAILIGLDKITAKSSEIVVNLNEIKQFGPL